MMSETSVGCQAEWRQSAPVAGGWDQIVTTAPDWTKQEVDNVQESQQCVTGVRWWYHVTAAVDGLTDDFSAQYQLKFVLSERAPDTLYGNVTDAGTLCQ